MEEDKETGDWYLNRWKTPLFSTEQRPKLFRRGRPYRCLRMAVFMSPLDVHVNRAPAAGRTGELNIAGKRATSRPVSPSLHQRKPIQRRVSFSPSTGKRR